MKTSDIIEYRSDYYKQHKDKIKENAKLYKQTHKEKTAINQILYRLNNGDNTNIRLSTKEKYQIYYDTNDKLFKSKLYNDHLINKNNLSDFNITS